MTIADSLLTSIAFNADGLVPCIAQCHKTGRVLMMAWMNRESVEQTLSKGEAVYWSRSRQQLWHKGETSGHIQKIHSVQIDCDGDTLLLSVEQKGDIACHTGTNSCFFREYDESSEDWRIIEKPLKSSEDIYQS